MINGSHSRGAEPPEHPFVLSSLFSMKLKEDAIRLAGDESLEIIFSR